MSLWCTKQDNNPVHHGFTNNLRNYQWSSYSGILDDKPTKLCKSEVIEWFENIENFKYFHSIRHELDDTKDLLKNRDRHAISPGYGMS
ncbi:MAG: hypothetical protein EHM20_09600, partial [Alphaproteobacteria bacterium]